MVLITSLECVDECVCVCGGGERVERKEGA